MSGLPRVRAVVPGSWAVRLGGPSSFTRISGATADAYRLGNLAAGRSGGRGLPGLRERPITAAETLRGGGGSSTPSGRGPRLRCRGTAPATIDCARRGDRARKPRTGLPVCGPASACLRRRLACNLPGLQIQGGSRVSLRALRAPAGHGCACGGDSRAFAVGPRRRRAAERTPAPVPAGSTAPWLRDPRRTIDTLGPRRSSSP